MLFARVRHERNLRQYLRQLEASGDIYIHTGQGRTHRSMYLVATGMPEEEIFEVLIDRAFFDMDSAEAAQVARAIVERQSQAQAAFEQTVPLSELRKRRRYGAGPRAEATKRISQSSFPQKRGSGRAQKEDQPILEKEDQLILEKGDQLIHGKGAFRPSQCGEPAAEPPDHEPPCRTVQEPPPLPEARTAEDGGGDGMSPTASYLFDEVHTNPAVARELADLPQEPVQRLVAQKRQAGAQTGAIIQALRLSRDRLLREGRAQEHAAPAPSIANLREMALSIAPDATGVALQYILLDLEEGYSFDEARQRFHERNEATYA